MDILLQLRTASALPSADCVGISGRHPLDYAPLAYAQTLSAKRFGVFEQLAGLQNLIRESERRRDPVRIK
jgi:hypothetical protein